MYFKSTILVTFLMIGLSAHACGGGFFDVCDYSPPLIVRHAKAGDTQEQKKPDPDKKDNYDKAIELVQRQIRRKVALKKDGE